MAVFRKEYKFPKSPQMKKNHSPGGIRIALRMLFYAITFIAVIGARENITAGTGPVSKTVAKGFNEVLLASSKLGIGFAVMNHRRGDENTVVGKGSRMLYKMSLRGFVNASKMNFYASL